MISAEQVINRAGDEGVMPLLTLDEFFDGNDNEGCIAPNQWGYGRSALAELAERFRAIERREDVAWVRVQLHPETLEMDELAGEAVAICTTADESVCAAWIEGFEASGVIPELVDVFRDIPEVPPGATVWSIVWD
ncbi:MULTISPECIES: hypothetical protein [Kitasatospora]|uniref:DUF4253 domain-containing protein n=1 Tax=Kitasatospora cathayae TaxID=3004092 RepID=A0ABY7QGG1_9ACTN|nr:hypothetical protein [Kitasatospora sp. HUAS 3-15]WBP84618.1 hypothetical protein O1G21_01285 [Kitasatospora sp. HUAS 3-15]WBP91221.1 hypothetical protein O1G21_38650 [Kitasatospora sp. HUAS 3-15]